MTGNKLPIRLFYDTPQAENYAKALGYLDELYFEGRGPGIFTNIDPSSETREACGH